MGVEPTAKPKSSQDLVQRVMQYFKKEGYKVEQSMTTLEGFTGISRRFDLIVQKGRVAQGVWIRDWNRTIGVNIIINMDKASERSGFSSPILVAEKFSEHAKAYANRRGIMLITKFEIMRSLM